jgi:hypothetical protein
MASRSKVPAARNLWESLRGNTLRALKKKGKKGPEWEDGNWLSAGEVETLLGRLRVLLAHIESNAQPHEVLFSASSGALPGPESKEVALALIEAIANDDTVMLVKTLQRYSCVTLAGVVKMVLICSPEPLVPGKATQLLLNSCHKYAEYLDERDEEKVEEMGATLQRFAQQGSLDALEGLCQFLKRLGKPSDELAYIFAPVVLLPKLGMLTDEALGEDEVTANFELLAQADGVIEAMEFMIDHADVLFDSRQRKRALLKKGMAAATAQQLERQQQRAQEQQQQQQQQQAQQLQHEGVKVQEHKHGDTPSPSWGEEEEEEAEEEQQQHCESDEDEDDDAFPVLGESQGNDWPSLRLARSASVVLPPPLLDLSVDFSSAGAAGSAEQPPPPLPPCTPTKRSFKLPRSPTSPSPTGAAGGAGADFTLREPLFSAIALWDYAPVEEGEISLTRGQAVSVLLTEEDGWWYGMNGEGVIGVFPGSYVARDMTPPASQAGSPNQDEALGSGSRSHRGSRSCSGSAVLLSGQSAGSVFSEFAVLESRCATLEASLATLQQRLSAHLGIELTSQDHANFLYLETMVSTVLDRVDKLSEENAKLRRFFVPPVAAMTR